MDEGKGQPRVHHGGEKINRHREKKIKSVQTKVKKGFVLRGEPFP